MLMSSKNAAKKIDEAYKRGRKELAAAIESWHKKYAGEKMHLESAYSPNLFKEFCLNVWDDFVEEEGTYAYIEMSEVPDSVTFDVLNHVLSFVRSNEKIASTGARIGMRYYDSSAEHPGLIGSEYEFSSFKRWELTFVNVTYQSLECIVEELKSVPSFNGKKIDVISES